MPDEAPTPATPLPYAPTKPAWWRQIPVLGALVLGLTSLLGLLFTWPAHETGLTLVMGLSVFLVGGLALLTTRPGRRFTLTGLLLGTLAAGISGLGLLRTPPTAPCACCILTSEIQLRNLGAAISNYRDDHAQANPPDLLSLKGSYFYNQAEVTHPDRDPFAPGGGRLTDYFYHPPASDAPPDAILVCEYADCPGTGRVVLFVNGKVERLTDAAFAAELTKPHNAAFAAALRAAEGP